MVFKEDYKIPDYVNDKKKYEEAFLVAKETYKKPSAYRSMYLAKVYKKMGGTYDEELKLKKGRNKTKDWLAENWVQIEPFVNDNTKKKCGAGDNTKACRPLNNVKGADDNMTMSDILKKWGKAKVLELVNKKREDMEGRLDWVTGTFENSEIRQKKEEKRKTEKKK